MAKKYHCDICNSEITRGYTVSYSPTLEENAHGVAWENDTTFNVCDECWPGQNNLLDRLLPF